MLSPPRAAGSPRPPSPATSASWAWRSRATRSAVRATHLRSEHAAPILTRPLRPFFRSSGAARPPRRTSSSWSPSSARPRRSHGRLIARGIHWWSARWRVTTRFSSWRGARAMPAPSRASFPSSRASLSGPDPLISGGTSPRGGARGGARCSLARPAGESAPRQAPRYASGCSPARARSQRSSGVEILPEPGDLGAGELEANAPVGDLRHLLGRDVPGPPEQARRDRETVEDVDATVADRLLHPPDEMAVAVDHLPARLDHEPGDRVAHMTFPPAYQTGPWVATGLVSESTRRTRSRPWIPASSSRARQRLAICGEAPYPDTRATRKRNPGVP